MNDLREKPKPTQKSSSLIIRRVPQALEVKNKKRAKRENEEGPRGVAGLIYVENMTQKNHNPDNILKIQRQQEKLIFFFFWFFKISFNFISHSTNCCRLYLYIIDSAFRNLPFIAEFEWRRMYNAAAESLKK